MPDGDSLVKMLNVGVGCGHDSTESASCKVHNPARILPGGGSWKRGNHDVSVHGRRRERFSLQCMVSDVGWRVMKQ
jgi:hypothetical protein